MSLFKYKVTSFFCRSLSFSFYRVLFDRRIPLPALMCRRVILPVHRISVYCTLRTARQSGMRGLPEAVAQMTSGIRTRVLFKAYFAPSNPQSLSWWRKNRDGRYVVHMPQTGAEKLPEERVRPEHYMEGSLRILRTKISAERKLWIM